MTADLLPNAVKQFIDKNGDPVALGSVGYYVPGTMTPKATWQDSGQTILNTNPISLDAAGECIVWGGGAYREIIEDQNGNLVWDRVTSTATPESIGAMKTDFSNRTTDLPSSAVDFLQEGAGAVSLTAQNKMRQIVSVLDYGAVGDGTTDDSVNIQHAVDANKGGCIVLPAGYNFLCGGVVLNGSSYNNTTVLIQGHVTLSPATGTNFQGACWAGFVLASCDGCSIDVTGVIDGNRANQPATEFIFPVLIAGATNYRIPNFNCKEIRGDGIYIGQSTLGSSGTVPTNGQIGPVVGYNSADDGRNLVTINSCDGLTIASINSVGIGGTIGGAREPGGLDIEPDQPYQTVNAVTIGPCVIKTGGTFGLNIAGKAVTSDSARDWNVTNVKISSATITGTAADFGGAAFERVRGLNIGTSDVIRTGGTGPGWTFDLCDGIVADVGGQGCDDVLICGFVDYVNDFQINCRVPNFSGSAIVACGVNNGRFTGVEINPTASGSYGIEAAVGGSTGNHPSAVTQTNVRYSVDVPYSSNLSGAFLSTAAVTFTGCAICDCSFAGYTGFIAQAVLGSFLPSQNVFGRNDAAAIPTDGNWAKGDYVRNTNPVIATGKVILGWSRLTNGTGNTAGTDWTPVYGTTT